MQGEFKTAKDHIPVEELKRTDPILFYDDVMLYEDELADNGTAMMNVRVRVMPERLLLLCRFFMRLDNVVFRVRDTRIYVDYATRKVIREYVAREDTYDNVRRSIPPGEDIGIFLRDPNWVCQRLPIVESKTEVLVSQ